MGLSHSPRIVTNGLVLCLDAGNRRSYPGSGTTWTDLTGRTTGTIFNTPSYSATDGNGSFTFVAASSQYVNLGSTSVFDNLFSTGITFQAWIKATSYTTFNRIISINNSTNTDYQYYIQTNGTSGVIELGTGIGVLAQSSSAVGIGSWVNIAGTCFYGASSMAIYLNGVSNLGTTTGTPSYTSDLGTGYIGRLDATSTAYYGNSTISNVQIYNRALSAAEIRQNFNALRGRYGI